MITIKKPIAKLHKSETRLGLEVKKKTAVKKSTVSYNGVKIGSKVFVKKLNKTGKVFLLDRHDGDWYAVKFSDGSEKTLVRKDFTLKKAKK